MVLKSEAIWWPVRKFPISGTCLHSKRHTTGPSGLVSLAPSLVFPELESVQDSAAKSRFYYTLAGQCCQRFSFLFLCLIPPHPFGRMILINDSLENSHKSVGRQTVLQSYCGVRKMEGRVAEGFHTMPSVWALTDKTSPVDGCKSQSQRRIQWKLRTCGICELNGGHIRRKGFGLSFPSCTINKQDGQSPESTLTPEQMKMVCVEQGTTGESCFLSIFLCLAKF